MNLKTKSLNKQNARVAITIFAAFLLAGFTYFFLGNYDLSPKEDNTICIDSEIKKDVFSYVSEDYVEKCPDASVLVSKNRNDDFDDIVEKKMLYVPVTSVKNEIDNISKQNIEMIFEEEVLSWSEFGGDNSEINVYALDSSQNTELWQNLFSLDNFSFKRIAKKDILNKILADKDSISFLPISLVDSRVKILKVDEKSFHEEAYPYLLTYYMHTQGEDPAIKEAISQYFEEQGGGIIEIIAVGDIMLSRHVGTKIRESGDNSLPFRKLSEYLSDADITFGNLESPFYDQGAPITAGMVFKGEPETIEGLKLAGFDILSLANNHFGNQGSAGMKYTFDYLKKNGIEYFGAGKNIDEAHNHKIIEVNGSKIGFLSYNEIVPESYEAGDNIAGIAWFSEENDILEIEKDIKEAKQGVDFLVLSFHWGTEYTPNPTDFQKSVARRAVGAGADVILAQHPHVVQAIEYIEGVPVFYSLGNFVFDQMWSEETREGIMVKNYIMNNKLVSYEMVPTKIYDYNQPRIADEKTAKKIINRILEASAI